MDNDISQERGGQLEFRYIDTSITEQQWHRVEPADNALARPLGCFEQLNWFGPRVR